MKDHSNPLSRPYAVRLAEQGFLYKVTLPIGGIEPYTLYDVNSWLAEHGSIPKVNHIMSNWVYYFKDEQLATLFALKWA